MFRTVECHTINVVCKDPSWRQSNVTRKWGYSFHNWRLCQSSYGFNGIFLTVYVLTYFYWKYTLWPYTCKSVGYISLFTWHLFIYVYTLIYILFSYLWGFLSTNHYQFCQPILLWYDNQQYAYWKHFLHKFSGRTN